MYDASHMPFTRFDLKQTSTFSETIYKHIKKLILSGQLKANRRITIQEFADYFNVSITPVREAFQRLIADEYLKISARNQFKVIGLSMEDVNKIFELTKALDVFGMIKNLLHIPDEVVWELKKMNDRLTEYYKKKHLKLYLKQNLEIHFRIWKEYKNDFIYHTLTNAQEKIIIIIGISPDIFYTPKVLEKSHDEHCQLLVAIERRDVNLAKRILERHWKENFFIE